MRFVKALLLPVLVVAGWTATTATTTAAHAVGTCSVAIPAKVSVKAVQTTITARLKADCAASDMDSADWGAGQPLIWGFSSSNSSATATYYATMPLGARRAVGQGAVDSGGNSLTQNTVSFVIKNGTWAYSASSRRGKIVYVHGLVHQWDLSTLDAPSGRKVYLQRYIHGGWQTMLSRTTVGGQVTVGFVQTAVHQYRWTVAESTQAWAATSASTFR